jgi:hypothetical protein
MAIDLSKGSEDRIKRIQELKPGLSELEIIERGIAAYWLALEKREMRKEK